MLPISRLRSRNNIGQYEVIRRLDQNGVGFNCCTRIRARVNFSLCGYELSDVSLKAVITERGVLWCVRAEYSFFVCSNKTMLSFLHTSLSNIDLNFCNPIGSTTFRGAWSTQRSNNPRVNAVAGVSLC